MSITRSDGPANLDRPSKAYREATLSLVYRLSELTFGSLLAAYSLGFVGLIAANWMAMFQHGTWGVVLGSAQYASISITFAYLTASFYLTYHTGILTMPQMPLSRLGIDFALAIVQALFFGFSMLRPWSFPVLLGINLCLAGRRQSKEFEALAAVLFNGICKRKGRINDDKFVKFRSGLRKHLRDDFSELSGWGPMGSAIRNVAIIMLIVGLSIGYLVVGFLPNNWLLRNIWGLNSNWFFQQGLITFEVLLFTVLITVKGHLVLKRRAKFLEIPIKGDNDAVECVTDMDDLPFIVSYWWLGGAVFMDYKEPESRPTPKMDSQFKELEEELTKLCTE